MEVGTTKELVADIWSGNHSFYTGTQKIMDTEGRVDKFEKRYSKKLKLQKNKYANNTTIIRLNRTKKAFSKAPH